MFYQVQVLYRVSECHDKISQENTTEFVILAVLGCSRSTDQGTVVNKKVVPHSSTHKKGTFKLLTYLLPAIALLFKKYFIYRITLFDEQTIKKKTSGTEFPMWNMKTFWKQIVMVTEHAEYTSCHRNVHLKMVNMVNFMILFTTIKNV